MNAMNESLQLSAEGLALIKRSEGLRLTVYKDVAGNATIGYGHLVLDHENFDAGISETDATQILDRDQAAACSIVRRLVNVPLKQGQFDCLADFTFNMGGHALATSHLLASLNGGNYGAVAYELYHVDDLGIPHGWIYAGGKPRDALIERRKAEIALWNA